MICDASPPKVTNGRDFNLASGEADDAGLAHFDFTRSVSRKNWQAYFRDRGVEATAILATKITWCHGNGDCGCSRWQILNPAQRSQNVPKFSLEKILKLYTENDPRNPHTGQRDRTTTKETIQDDSTEKTTGPDPKNEHSGSTQEILVSPFHYRPPPSHNKSTATNTNNHEPKRQNKPQRTTRRTTSRPWLFHRHANTWTKIPDKKWTMDARGER